jgi:phosphate transport system substrate-binding protein
MDTLLLPSSEGITKEILYNQNAIGYDGLGYVTPEVKVLAVARENGGPYILPSEETVDSNQYPIARDLYIYSDGDPSGAIKEYLDWLLTPEAQKIVTELGFVAIKDQ